MFSGMDGIWSATDENNAIDNHGEKLYVILFVVVYFFILQSARSHGMQHCCPLMLA